MIIELSIIQSVRIRLIRQIRERTDHANCSDEPEISFSNVYFSLTLDRL